MQYSTKEGKSINLDNYLVPNLDEIKRIQKHDGDCLAILDGKVGCISGDTIIRCNRATLGKKFTIKWMFNQLHGNPQNVKHLKPWNLSIDSFVRSYDGSIIRLHKIKDVVYSGKKIVRKLILEDGKQIKLTPEHKVMTQEGWIELQHLNIQKHLVMIDIPKAEKKYSRLYKMRDAELYGLGNHPYARKGNRLPAHRLIYEAKINGYKLEDFLNMIINSPEKIKDLKFINPTEFDIHHIDSNHYNNTPENLTILTKEEHMKHHAKDAYLNFNQGKPAFVKIESISDVGEEDTYDIICEEPYHNFSANDIIIHNSGKSSLAQQIAGYLDADFDISKVCFDGDSFTKAVINAKKGSTIIFDEALSALNTKRSMSSITVTLVSLLTEIRQKNLCILLCLPSIFDLDRTLAIHRSLFLLHIFTNKGKKGYYTFYGDKRKNKLLGNIQAKRTYNYFVKGSFVGHFNAGYIIDEKEYRKLKEDVLKRYIPDAKKILDPEQAVRDKEIEMIKKLSDAGITPYQLGKMGIVKQSTAYKYLKQAKDSTPSVTPIKTYSSSNRKNGETDE